MTTTSGPVVYLPGDVRKNSRAYGLPVVSDDGYNHSPECYWCNGNANRDTCPRSVAMDEYVRRFRREGGRCADCGEDLPDCSCSPEEVACRG